MKPIRDPTYIETPGSYPLDTTTIQEYGTISFTIGPTKTQKAYINSSGLTATAFSGNGAALTNLAYANIDGKPTNFQADWNSTIINKPSTFPAIRVGVNKGKTYYWCCCGLSKAQPFCDNSHKKDAQNIGESRYLSRGNCDPGSY